MTTFSLTEYRPAGPTIARFHASSEFHRWIAGPIGSGKTTAAGPIEAALTVIQQRPDDNGVRRASVGVLRDTYRNLYATTLETWFKIFPRDLGSFVGSDDRPARHRLSFPAPQLDKFGQPTGQMGLCELDAQFRALGTNAVEAVCRGWETMGAFIDEEDLVPAEARPFLAGRVQRGGDVRFRVSRGVWGAFNKPDVDHPLFQLHEDADPGFFDQPGGLLPGGPPYVTNPKAENLAYLDDGYYLRSADKQPEWYIRRMLRNQWGASVAGEPVYDETIFDADRHCSQVELEPGVGEELVLGIDGGGTPAAVVMGRTPTGRRIVYAEVVLIDPTDKRQLKLQHGVGPRRFAQAISDVLAPRFSRCRVQLGYGDPAAFYGADREAGEYSFMEIVGNELKIAITPASSNEIYLRHEAVKTLLGRPNRGDGRPDLIINRSCRFTRSGFASDYKFEPRDPKQPGKTLKPVKSRTSHVHDALQYACLGDQGRAGVTAGAKYDRFYQVPRTELERAGASMWREHEARVAAETGGGSYRADFNPWTS